MVDIIFYSVMELLTAFSPNYTVFLIFRALYGIGMGGEWGLGASLAMESLPARARGLVSGILATRLFACGFLLAAIGLLARLSALRVARSFCRRRAAGVARHLHPGARAGVGGLGTKPAGGAQVVRHGPVHRGNTGGSLFMPCS